MNQIIPIFSQEDAERQALLRMELARERHNERLHELVVRKLDNMQNEADEMMRRAGELVRLGGDVSKELAEMETFEKGFQLARLLLLNANTKAQ